MALAAAWACRNTGRVAGGWRQLHLVDATHRRTRVGAERVDGVAWRTVPTFVAGVLATLAAAPLVRFRGPARADSACYRLGGAVVGGGVAALGRGAGGGGWP
jgi:hypothetical protein